MLYFREGEDQRLQEKSSSNYVRRNTNPYLRKEAEASSSSRFLGGFVAYTEGFFGGSRTEHRYRRIPTIVSQSTKPIKCRDGTSVYPWSAPSRESHIKSLREDKFDVIVIGGGCVGNGVALDAATRGLKVALIERDDFSAGTSGNQLLF